MIDRDKVLQLAGERMNERNPNLYVVELKINSGNQILLEIDDTEGSVSIEDCVSISRNIEHNLDREIDDFSLEVSSAGLDKPFRVRKQYIKNIGREVKVKPAVHGKDTIGVLKKVDEDGIVVETKEKKRLEGRKKKVWVTEEVPFKYEEIKETKLIISF